MKRNIGVRFIEHNKARAVVWAPLCETVEMEMPESKKKVVTLEKDAYGYWQAEVDLLPGTLYRYILNGEKIRPDPASVSQPQGVHGPSEAVNVTEFDWEDRDWKNVPLGKLVFYELHVGTFTSEGTFEAILTKLKHLKDLGINAIELMPVAQFSGERNWGYDGVFPFAVHHSYGGVRGLQNLVNQCHKEGIAVILDVVYNHLGPEGNYLPDFGPYFTDKYHTPWGLALNFDDAGCNGIRNYFIQNAIMWLRDFHIDGLRLDAVHAIKDMSPKNILREIVEEAERLSDESGIMKHLIAECDLNDAKYIQPREIGGYGLHCQWIDEFHHAIHVFITGDKKSFYSDYGQLDHIRRAFADAYVYNGQYSLYRQKTFGNEVPDRPFNQFIVFSHNHDIVGNRILGERLSTMVSFEILKLFAGAVILSPFLPLLFMGEEYGETNPFQYFTSHADEKLAESVRQGRKKDFKAFYGTSEVPDPQSKETFDNSKLSWNMGNYKSTVLLNYYKQLISIRKGNPVFYDYNRRNLNARISENEVLMVHKVSGEQELLLLMNFNKEDIFDKIHLTGKGNWLKIMDSSDREWSGPGSEVPFTFSNRMDFKIRATSMAVYRRAIGFYDIEKAMASET